MQTLATFTQQAELRFRKNIKKRLFSNYFKKLKYTPIFARTFSIIEGDYSGCYATILNYDELKNSFHCLVSGEGNSKFIDIHECNLEQWNNIFGKTLMERHSEKLSSEIEEWATWQFKPLDL